MAKLRFVGVERDLWVGDWGISAMCVYEDTDTLERYCFSGRIGWFQIRGEEIVDVAPPAEFASLPQPPEWESYLKEIEGPDHAVHL